MKYLKNPKIKPIIIALLLIFSLTTGIVYNSVNKEEVKQEKDAITFKEEYEAFNGLTVEGTDKTYLSMDLPENNPMYYATYEEVEQVLEGTGVIYLGYPQCPWCRNLVPTLIEAAKKVNVTKIYYINMYNERNILSLNEEGEIITEKEGTEGYLSLVEKLNDILPVYEGLNDDTIKRIYVPFVIFVKNGKIIGTHSGTVESQEDPYIALSEEQQTELKTTLHEYLLEISSSTCDSSC
jgi:thiol-disulfide isomerase/thioredoxin